MEGDENHDFSYWVTKLLQDTEPENDFKRFKTSNFHAIIKRAGNDVGESNVEQWLDNGDGDPGYQILRQEEITESVLQDKEEDDYVDEEDDNVAEEELASSCPKLSVIRNHMDDVISHKGASSDPEVLP
jgi:hypothetical protein